MNEIIKFFERMKKECTNHTSKGCDYCPVENLCNYFYYAPSKFDLDDIKKRVAKLFKVKIYNQNDNLNIGVDWAVGEDFTVIIFFNKTKNGIKVLNRIVLNKKESAVLQEYVKRN